MRRRRLIRARPFPRLQQQSQRLTLAEPAGEGSSPFPVHCIADDGELQRSLEAGRGGGGGGGGGHAATAAAEVPARHGALADAVAALVASVVTSVVEGPLDLFLNRARVAPPLLLPAHTSSTCTRRPHLHLTSAAFMTGAVVQQLRTSKIRPTPRL